MRRMRLGDSGVWLSLARAGEPTMEPGEGWIWFRQSFPLFVIGFLAMALVNSLGGLRWLSGVIGHDVGSILRETSRAMILVALAGVGLSTRLQAMRRTGWKPFAIGFAVAALTSGASLLLIHFLGPASG